MTINLNFDCFQTADDGNTTHYGGTVQVNDYHVPAMGSDRELNLLIDVHTEIERQIGRELTSDEQELIDRAIAVEDNCSLDLD